MTTLPSSTAPLWPGEGGHYIIVTWRIIYHSIRIFTRFPIWKRDTNRTRTDRDIFKVPGHYTERPGKMSTPYFSRNGRSIYHSVRNLTHFLRLKTACKSSKNWESYIQNTISQSRNWPKKWDPLNLIETTHSIYRSVRICKQIPNLKSPFNLVNNSQSYDPNTPREQSMGGIKLLYSPILFISLPFLPILCT